MKRALIPLLLAGLLAACGSGVPHVTFEHGVASGDPLADAVILWTRVTPAGDDPRPVPVTWEIAEDDAFDAVVSKGEAVTDAAATPSTRPIPTRGSSTAPIAVPDLEGLAIVGGDEERVRRFVERLMRLRALGLPWNLDACGVLSSRSQGMTRCSPRGSS